MRREEYIERKLAPGRQSQLAVAVGSDQSQCSEFGVQCSEFSDQYSVARHPELVSGSATSEENSNRFLSHASFGMTKGLQREEMNDECRMKNMEYRSEEEEVGSRKSSRFDKATRDARLADGQGSAAFASLPEDGRPKLEERVQFSETQILGARASQKLLVELIPMESGSSVISDQYSVALHPELPARHRSDGVSGSATSEQMSNGFYHPTAVNAVPPSLNPLSHPTHLPYADISPIWGKQSGLFYFMRGNNPASEQVWCLKPQLEKEYFSSLEPARLDWSDGEEYSRQVGREVVNKAQSPKLEARNSQLLNLDTCVLILDSCVLSLATCVSILESCVLILDTKKLNNSPSRREWSKHKTSHLSALQLAGAIKPKTVPFLAYQFGMRMFSPLGEMSAGQRGEPEWGLTNNLKTKHAYET